MLRIATPATAALALAACHPAAEGPNGTTRDAPGEAFAAIAPEETIHFTGTEPFWGGEVSGTSLVYTTPDKPEGAAFAVTRFAGNNGLGFSGRLENEPFDMAVTAGECSDGMSDRSYPFVVTLKIGDDQRDGCAWTDATPFSGPQAP